MRATRAKQHIDGANVSLFPDLSQKSLMQRCAVRLLLEALLSVYELYAQFPFCLMATRNGRSAVLCTRDDLLQFLETLDLLPTAFPDWRLHNNIPLPQHPECWRQASSGSRKRNRTSCRGHGSTPSPI